MSRAARKYAPVKIVGLKSDYVIILARLFSGILQSLVKRLVLFGLRIIVYFKLIFLFKAPHF